MVTLMLAIIITCLIIFQRCLPIFQDHVYYTIVYIDNLPIYPFIRIAIS